MCYAQISLYLRVKTIFITLKIVFFYLKSDKQIKTEKKTKFDVFGICVHRLSNNAKA